VRSRSIASRCWLRTDGTWLVALLGHVGPHCVRRRCKASTCPGRTNTTAAREGQRIPTGKLEGGRGSGREQNARPDIGMVRSIRPVCPRRRGARSCPAFSCAAGCL
jgi:hypothetical protein